MNYINTKNAPAAIGPYSQAIDLGDFVFLSGQIPADAETGKLTEGSIEEKTSVVFKNIGAILKEAGLEPKNVVKTTVFVKDLGNFGKVNGIYANFFGDHKPARSFVEVSDLPKGVDIEIELIAKR
ncbi:MAG: 2-iminobutanoate/2-iminopropanoate deaminase [Kosmotogales bacterium]|nr:2-iminobutanoate/2-iminopropanoate deaminase [Kosmotogales bacterium]